MSERNISDDEVRSYMANAKVMFMQWNGQRRVFYSPDGVAVIKKSNDDWIYKTTFNKHDFDEEILLILKVVDKYVK